MKRFCLFLCLGGILFVAGTVQAAGEKTGVLIMAHGGAEQWNRLVEEAAAMQQGIDRLLGKKEVSTVVRNSPGWNARPVRSAFGRGSGSGCREHWTIPLWWPKSSWIGF
ncbi:MAG: hypothetical protein NC910_00825 [Candidatus Omnitrophica bacterium]|nr:hypothetical protein [Candidatus Omnitrophota bacterium]